MEFTEFNLLALIATVFVVSYAIWGVHRLFVVFGKCPQCNHRLNRTAEICNACGCRQHEYVAERKQRNIQRRTATN